MIGCVWSKVLLLWDESLAPNNPSGQKCEVVIATYSVKGKIQNVGKTVPVDQLRQLHRYEVTLKNKIPINHLVGNTFDISNVFFSA